jgi:hypothetical protein
MKYISKSTVLIIALVLAISSVYNLVVTNHVLIQVTSSKSNIHQEETEHHYMNSTKATISTTFNAILATIPPEGPDTRIRPFLEKTIMPKKEQSEGFMIEMPDGSSCSPTSQVQIIQSTIHSIDGGMNKTQVLLQSIDEYGNFQTQGGDEFVVIYLDEIEIRRLKQQQPINVHKPYDLSPTAYAVAFDNLDGTYNLDFVRPPMTELFYLENNIAFQPTGRGMLFVTLHYTCGHGRMTKPTKDQWTNGGSLWFLDWFVQNMTLPIEAIRTYEPTPSLNTETYDRIICFGDSLIQNSCGVWWEEYLFRKPKLDTLPMNYGVPLSNRNHSSVDHVLTDLDNFIGRSSNVLEQKTVILTGSSAWDAFSNLYNNSFDFHETLENNRYIVTQLKKKYPNATIIWRGPSALHLGVLGIECLDEKGKCTERVRYMSNSVTQYLNHRQKSLMEELGVYYLDVWEMSYLSGNWHMDGDAQHFRKWLQYMFIDQLYPVIERQYHGMNKTNWIER